MSFGYPKINYVYNYSDLSNNRYSQVRRSVDMVYQRGGSYSVLLTGTTYVDSMELVVDMYADDVKVGQMSIVPYDVTFTTGYYFYSFTFRPYDYLSNYLNPQHYTKYIDAPFAYFNPYTNANYADFNSRTAGNYKNILQANYKYGYRYYSGTTLVTEYSGTTPTNDYYHCYFTGCTLTNGSGSLTPGIGSIRGNGNKFDYIGGQLQLDENFILPNFDQEIGEAYQYQMAGTNNVDYERNWSPASQFIFSYPRTPYQSEVSRFLTDAPRIQYVESDDSYALYYLVGQTGDRKVIETDVLQIRFYDENNNQIDGYETQLIDSSAPYGNFRAPTGFTDTLSIWALPCGPQDFINMALGTTTSPNLAYYTVQIFGSYPTDNASRGAGIVPVSEKFYFYLKDNCGPESTRIAWLNNRGGYDYYTFTAYRQDTKKISRQTYDNRQYQVQPNSPDRAFGRTIKTFATDVEQEIVLESDFLNLATADWIQQMFYSPQVYIMKADYKPTAFGNSLFFLKDLTPVQVLSTEVDTITKKHQKLNKYRITMKVANNFFVNKGF